MADPHILSTLRRKRDEIEGVIAVYGKKIAEAQRDLASVNSVLRLFELNGEPQDFPAYVDISRVWRRGEIVGACRLLLEAEGPLDTRELARRLVRMKGLDEGDAVLRQSVSYRVVQALAIAAKRGKIGSAGKRGGICVWRRQC